MFLKSLLSSSDSRKLESFQNKNTINSSFAKFGRLASFQKDDSHRL